MSDINGGVTANAIGSPFGPGTSFTGPLIAGNVLHSDGSGTLASTGGQSGTANAGYVVMAQSENITQAASTGQSAGVYKTGIVIPAQSQILRMTLAVTTAWTSTTTMGLGNTASATAYTGATAVQGSTIGLVAATPGTDSATTLRWLDVGNTDVQIVVTSGSTGSGVGVLTVEYIQGINLVAS